MGSLVVSDVVTDIPRYPHTMVATTHHTPQSSTQSYPQRFPTQNTSSNASSAVRAPSSTPRDIPGSRSNSSPVEAENVHEVAGETHHAANYHGEHGEEDGYDRSGFPLTSAPRGLTSTPPSPRLLPTMRSSLSLNLSGSASPNRIKVRDLSHIQAFASEEVLTRAQVSRPVKQRHDGQQYEISAMPVADIIEMVAGLLTKITTTNDRQHQHEQIHKHIPSPDGSSALSQQTASVLSFHGKNVPSITILSYLSRIHKYCPTTYEVFLSLLVYFDRMTEIVNERTLKSFQSSAENNGGNFHTSQSTSSIAGDSQRQTATPPSSSEPTLVEGPESPSLLEAVDSDDEPTKSPCFVVDSFNIHRLVIAGVTCASKFFSDVFYTNSRYAKVGGLPIHELNHLELQFLLLNDFRLSVPVEELEAYGSMLVEFYAQEVISQQTASQSPTGDGLYMNSGTPTPQ